MPHIGHSSKYEKYSPKLNHHVPEQAVNKDSVTQHVDMSMVFGCPRVITSVFMSLLCDNSQKESIFHLDLYLTGTRLFPNNVAVFRYIMNTYIK